MAEPSNATASPVAEKSPKPEETAQAGTADEGNESSNVSEGNPAEDTKPNGAATPTKPSTSGSQDDDTEMKDANNAAEATSTPTTTQTPASSKKAANGSSKKKSAVPEHKTKKLNKKASSKRMTNLDAEPGQYYLARMKGHPPWPSVICDEEMLPMSLLDTRPVTTKLPDGTYKKAEYADGGKRVHDRTFPIMFLHTNEFAWMPNTDLTPLETASIDPTDTKGKSKPLAAAYEKASEENDLQHYKDMLADHQKAVKEEQEAQAERDAKKSAKAKRKSVDASTTPADDDDEMDVDDEEEEPKPKSKKRKKEVESDAEEKPAKTPKTATKLKLSTPKTPVETSSKKKAPKPKSSTKKAPKESDDDAVETPKVEEKRMTAEEARNAKEKKVLWFRHKLQRGFLSRDVPPKEDEMKQMSDYLAELETYLDLEPSIIRSTKINKVLKAMIKIPSIPQDEIHQFKDRSLKILAEWNKTLSNEPGNDGQGDKEDDAKETAAAPTTNGTAKDTETQAAKAEAGEAAAPEEEKEEDLEKKIGTTTEGEKEAEKSEGQAAEEPEKVSDDKGDAPDVENAPAKEYQPPAVEAA
ncbi:MAG: hypothetical protein L6R38_004090 [Xanthoria sp. 2 TBL-2021]|nr:MAG: hypothetical protein L6R38_004090 [Xanthoria sp. 2 TBL-2021]